MAVLKELVASLARRWHISVAQIKGHQDYARTLCRGSHLEARLSEIRKVVADR